MRTCLFAIVVLVGALTVGCIADEPLLQTESSPPRELSADIAIRAIGTGRYVVQAPGCATDRRGGFDAIVAGTATYSIATRRWQIAVVDPTSLSIETTSGCAVEGIEVDTTTHLRISATVAIGVASCSLHCEGAVDPMCMPRCLDTPDVTLHAETELSVPVDLGASTPTQLRGHDLELTLAELVDGDGNVLHRRPHGEVDDEDGVALLRDIGSVMIASRH